MRSSFTLAFGLFALLVAAVQGRPERSRTGRIHYPQEKYLSNVRQLTFGGVNTQAYFSFDDQRITFQATNFGAECDQIFEFDLNDGAMTEDNQPEMISTGKGKSTDAFFYPDGEQVMYASTMGKTKKCPAAPCDNPVDASLKRACSKGASLWPVDEDFDIYLTNMTSGELEGQLTDRPGYDAEGVVSPIGDRVAFTSMRTGDLEIWTMKPDGSDKKQISNNNIGYDGGAFFSPDGQKLVWRASRPKNDLAILEYFQLLESNVVSPAEMELFVAPADGSGTPRQVTQLGGANWAPYWYPDNDRIIFSSNFNSTKAADGKFSNFNLFMIPESGNTSELEQITFDPTFDSFPMFTHAAPWRLIFASARNASEPGEINLFVADWEGNVPPMKTTPATTGGPTTTPSGGGEVTTENPPEEPTTKSAGMLHAVYTTLLTFAMAAIFANH